MGRCAQLETDHQRPIPVRDGSLASLPNADRASTRRAFVNARVVSKAKASSSLHAAPPPAPRRNVRTLALAVVGPGHVGSALLRQLRAAQSSVRRSHCLDIKLCAVVDSRHTWIDCDVAALNTRTGGALTWRPASLDELGPDPKSAPHAVLVDFSESEQHADHSL